MKIQLVTKPLTEIQNDYLILPIFENTKPSFNHELINQFLADNPNFGKLFETQLLYTKNTKVTLIGLGKKDKFSFENLQNWVGTAAKTLASKTKEASILIPGNGGSLPAEEVGQAIALGAEIALYDPSKEFKSDYKPPKLNSLEVIVEKAERGFQEGIKKGQVIAEAINLARNLGDMPANLMTPTYFLNVVKKTAKENKLTITVLDEKQAKRKGMGAFCGVAQGSNEPSFMIALEYKGDLRSKEKWGLVGKGITFDSGGISIKPADNMNEMKFDMTGAASVLATLIIISKLGLKTNVVGVMAVTENMPGGKAQKPGDIVKTYSGKTAEILNTDAEGRLVLIDAISYAQKDFKATKVIDLASLTGAIIVALGDHIAGTFSNNPQLAEELIKAGTEVGEKYWQLPMDEEFGEMIKSDIADIENSGHGGSMGWRTASSITGAKFIEAGVEENHPWVHLDIAGTAWEMKPRPFRAIGATGFGIKTLVKLIAG